MAGRILPHPLDAVIFDMDGLLLDSERLYRDAMRQVLAGQGRDLPEPLFLSLVGRPWPANRLTLAAHYGPGFDCEAHRSECFAAYEALAVGGTPLRPGAGDLLAWLAAAGVPLAVATSTATARAEAKLAGAGLRGFFAHVVGADDVARHKPDPAPYLHAAALLGARPAHCLALEDSHAGVRSAAAAGMVTIMVPDLLPPTAEIAGLCAAIVDSLADVRRLLADQAPV